MPVYRVRMLTWSVALALLLVGPGLNGTEKARATKIIKRWFKERDPAKRVAILQELAPLDHPGASDIKHFTRLCSKLVRTSGPERGRNAAVEAAFVAGLKSEEGWYGMARRFAAFRDPMGVISLLNDDAIALYAPAQHTDANGRARIETWFGPREVNFDYYTSWCGHDRVLVLPTAHARVIGVRTVRTDLLVDELALFRQAHALYQHGEPHAAPPRQSRPRVDCRR